MKIAYILPSLANKGPILVVKDLVAYLRKKADITVFYFDPICEVDFECPTIKINLLSSLNLSEFDIVHSHMLRPDGFLFFKRKTTRAKLVTTLHNYVELDLKNSHNRFISYLFSKIWGILLLRHDMLVTLSSHMQDYYKQIYRNPNIRYIYNGREIDQANSEPIPPNDVTRIKAFKGNSILLGVIAQVTERKGIDQIVRLLTQMPNIKLLVIGEGPAKADLLALTLKLAVSDRCMFLGYRPNAYRYNSLLDVYIMSSRSEGFALALIEAAAYGVPTVSSDLPVFLEAFTKEEISFYKLDNLESLQLALQHLLDNKEIFSRNILSRYYKDYTAKIMADKYFKLYQSLI